MNAKLHLISALAASLTLHGAAMPTEAEVEKAVPKVERMLASEKVAPHTPERNGGGLMRVDWA